MSVIETKRLKAQKTLLHILKFKLFFCLEKDEDKKLSRRQQQRAKKRVIKRTEKQSAKEELKQKKRKLEEEKIVEDSDEVSKI